jgi:thiamine-monophosphate kinase
LDAEALPLEPGIRETWPQDWLAVAGGGEDYELVFASPAATAEAVCARLRGEGLEASIVGRFDAGTGLRIRGGPGEEEQPAPSSGHQHFA